MKAKIIVVANNKGGVGKTALVANLGAAFARRDLNTLLLDLDGQANLTDSYLYESQIRATLASALKWKQPLPIHHLREHLDLIPSDAATGGIEKEVKNLYGALKQNLDTLSPSYDIILIDTPPNIGAATLSALFCAQELIVPLTAEPSALKGLSAMSRLAEQIKRERNRKLRLLAAVLTLYDSRKRLSKLVVNSVKSLYPQKLCSSTIRRSVSIAEAIVKKTDALSYDSKSKGARDYEELAEELLGRLK